MDADRGCSHELDAEFLGLSSRFFIQIVEDFHVIGDKADRLNDDALNIRLSV